MVWTESLQILGAGVVLGLSIAAPPGPVNATVALQIGTKSWIAGLLVGLGATTADAIFLGLTYLGWINVISRSGITPALFMLGGLLLLFFGVSAIRKARSTFQISSDKQSRAPYFLGISIGLTNPYQIAWWLTVGVAVISSFGPFAVLGFFSGITAWNLIYTTGLKLGIAKYERFSSIVLYVSAVILFSFGFWFLRSAISSLY